MKRARPSPPDFASLARELDQNGAVVVPLPARTPTELWTMTGSACSEFFEYNAPSREHTQFVLGGFGALGNPSSFHHPHIRTIRGDVKRTVAMPLLREWAQLQQLGEVHVEALFDRLCIRAKAYGKPTAEAWHRDEYDAKKYVSSKETPLRPLLEGDILIAGWLNCNEDTDDSRMQYFSYVPGTHKTGNGQGGFAPIAETAEFERTKVRLAVPPGHAMLFFQGTVHEVYAGVQPIQPSCRLFHGFRITQDQEPLWPELAQWLAEQAVPRIPSGQRPPLFSKMHYMHDKLTDWHKVFRSNVLKTKGKWTLPTLRDDRSMDSLQTYNGGMYAPYTEDETRVLFPE